MLLCDNYIDQVNTDNKTKMQKGDSVKSDHRKESLASEEYEYDEEYDEEIE